ncbi:hypothetical protein Tco_0801130 [Tanacetum coccineum]|uniref:Uncharacterized protein n=1 Tax=Tanacetum coccineum TaxID=301880 RepID=A0ABQ4ZYH9_9ASTR
MDSEVAHPKISTESKPMASEVVQPQCDLFLDKLEVGVSGNMDSEVAQPKTATKSKPMDRRTTQQMSGSRTLYFCLANRSEGGGEVKQSVVHVDPLEPRDRRLKNQLMWARNRKNDVRLFLLSLLQAITTHLPLQSATFISAVVVMLDETASELVKCSTKSIMNINDEVELEDSETEATCVEDGAPDDENDGYSLGKNKKKRYMIVTSSESE